MTETTIDVGLDVSANILTQGKKVDNGKEVVFESPVAGPEGYAVAFIEESGRHRHERTTENYYVVSGHGTLFYDDKVIPLEPDQHVRLTPGVAHHVESANHIKILVTTNPRFDPADLHPVPALRKGPVSRF